MRRSVSLFSAAVLATVVAAPAHAVPQHLHCMTNSSGNTHAIARGVTLQAPHEPALHKFHSNVHIGVFALGNNPHTLAGDLTAPFSC